MLAVRTQGTPNLPELKRLMVYEFLVSAEGNLVPCMDLFSLCILPLEVLKRSFGRSEDLVGTILLPSVIAGSEEASDCVLLCLKKETCPHKPILLLLAMLRVLLELLRESLTERQRNSRSPTPFCVARLGEDTVFWC